MIVNYHEEKLGTMSKDSPKRYPLYYFAGAIYCVVSQWILSGMRESPETLADAFLKIANAHPNDIY